MARHPRVSNRGALRRRADLSGSRGCPRDGAQLRDRGRAGVRARRAVRPAPGGGKRRVPGPRRAHEAGGRGNTRGIEADDGGGARGRREAKGGAQG